MTVSLAGRARTAHRTIADEPDDGSPRARGLAERPAIAFSGPPRRRRGSPRPPARALRPRRCPPRSSSRHHRRFRCTTSTATRGDRTISFGRIENPAGTVTGSVLRSPSNSRSSRRPKHQCGSAFTPTRRRARGRRRAASARTCPGPTSRATSPRSRLAGPRASRRARLRSCGAWCLAGRRRPSRPCDSVPRVPARVALLDSPALTGRR